MGIIYSHLPFSLDVYNSWIIGPFWFANSANSEINRGGPNLFIIIFPWDLSTWPEAQLALSAFGDTYEACFFFFRLSGGPIRRYFRYETSTSFLVGVLLHRVSVLLVTASLRLFHQLFGLMPWNHEAMRSDDTNEEQFFKNVSVLWMERNVLYRSFISVSYQVLESF